MHNGLRASDLKSNKAAHRVRLYFEKQHESALPAIQLYRAGSSVTTAMSAFRGFFMPAAIKIGAEDLLRRMIDDPASDDGVHVRERLLRTQVWRSAHRHLRGAFARRVNHHS